MLIALIFVFFVTCNCNPTSDYDTSIDDIYEERFGKIRHVSVLFRHGNRSPTSPLPASEEEKYFPEGPGQLLNAGKLKLFGVGEWFRRRYKSLLKERYYYTESKMETSEYDRTMMSAECFLAGFYPPSEVEIWSPDKLKWQPIPVHSIPSQEDNMIAASKICAVYYQELCRTNFDSKYKQLFANHKPFFDVVTKNTGIVFDENFVICAIVNVLELYDFFSVLEQNGLPLPKWTKSVLPEPMTSIALEGFELATHTHKMKRLKAGPFLKSITTDMSKKAYENLEENLHFYSGHDSTIIMVMNTLGIYNSLRPPYGSALAFELREKDAEFVVTILYKNSTDQPPILQEIPECDNPCRLEDFLDLTNAYIAEDWKKECQIQFPNAHASILNNYWETNELEPNATDCISSWSKLCTNLY